LYRNAGLQSIRRLDPASSCLFFCRGARNGTGTSLARSRSAQFWLDQQGQYDIAAVEREKGGEIAKRSAGVGSQSSILLMVERGAANSP